MSSAEMTAEERSAEAAAAKEWRTFINRAAEAMTIFAVVCADVFTVSTYMTYRSPPVAP